MVKDIKAEFLEKKSTSKSLYSDILFPEIQKELHENKSYIGELRGLFILIVKSQGKRVREWFLTFDGNTKPPSISTSKPEFSSKKIQKSLPVVIIEIEDKDIFKFITGGMHGMKALNEGRVKIAGDLTLALELEKVFIKAGGIEKTKAFLSKTKTKSKL